MLLWDAIMYGCQSCMATHDLTISQLFCKSKVNTTNGCLVLQRFTFRTVDDDKIIGLQNEYMIPAPPLHGLKVLIE